MLSHFFIDRPIFAWVIAILMMLAGILVIPISPIAQYPDIAPPEISITATYPGASASTVENSVTQIIEQQLKGLDHYNYMYSTSSSGSANITVSFDQEADPDIAQVQVQNKLQLATAMLPDEVQRQGIVVNKSSSSFFLVLSFISTDGSMSGNDLADYMNSYLIDPISRIPGVGDTQIFGNQFGMRIWLDPDLLTKYKVNASDISAAIQAQNNDVPAGEIGGPPALEGQRINFTVKAQSRLKTPEQFANIILRTNQDGSTVRIKDVATVELDADRILSYTRYSGTITDQDGAVQTVTGLSASGIGIKLASGANALQVADAVKAKVKELSEFFPAGMEYREVYDTTPFVRISLLEVVKTLIEAIILVFVLMFIFLQNFRATLIPTIAVPVVLLGTFGVMGIAGFSINTLTMFGMVLAIGLLVDDAIIVVENVERVMDEDRMNPRDAARKSMTEITGALVGIGLVLSAVFIPMAFFGGATGVIYRQFSITIVSAMALSVIVALVLTPSLCATMMKDPNAPGAHARKADGFFGLFNRGFDAFVKKYVAIVHALLQKPAKMVLLFVVLVSLMAYAFIKLPTSFLPEEDQGILMFQVQLPQGATFERTNAVLSEVERYFLGQEGDTVMSVMSVAGFSFNGLKQNNGIGFVRLKDWEERPDSRQKVQALAARAQRKMFYTGEGMVFFLVPPAIVELGTSSGFDMDIMDNSGHGHGALMKVREEILAKARADAVLAPQSVRQNGMPDETQYQLAIDYDKTMAQDLNIADVTATISSLWGSYYVNNFIDKGRSKKVMVQVDKNFRMQPGDFSRIRIRNDKGEMVPLSGITSGSWTTDSPRLERFNGVSSLEFQGAAKTGFSSGEAMNSIERIAKETLPLGMGMAWRGLSYQEKMSGDQAPMLYAVSMIVVFLCLAALYESWSIPVSVILIIPMGVIGAVGGAYLRGLTNDVYFQVGLLTIIGLSAKNAILIVEFAKALEEQGMGLIEATVEACRLRIRPIVMTSFAFILGTFPLAKSTGAGSGAQNAIGTAVVSGMLSATILGVFFIPLSFVLISKLFKVKVQTHDKPAVQSGNNASSGGSNS